MKIIKDNITLEGINLINRQLVFDKLTDTVEKFKHSVTLNGAIDISKKFVTVRVNVNVDDASTDNLLGSMTVDFIYSIPDFDAVFDVLKSNKADDSDEILTILSHQSIATMRGIMFESFRGTPLHNAYLPISLNQEELAKKSISKKTKQK
jgi:hypothetical protein